VEVILVIFLTIFIVRYYFSMGIVAKHPTTTTTNVYSKSSPSINNATVKLPSPNLQEEEAARSARLQSPDHSSTSAPSSVNSTIETISKPDDEDVFSKPIIEPVWGSLARILKRPETLQAAQEASKAGILGWKELMKEIESDEAAFNRTSNHTSPQGWKKVGVESRQCPNSSTFSDFSSASSGLSSTQQQPQGSSWRSSSSHYELPIPCGLVVDSSITIVATPGGQQSGDSFEIALLGPSQLKGEADDTPIFLNYSVQFTGDDNNSTNPPVIVQSTWTSEKQWQHEERCPSSSYSSPAIDKHPGSRASLKKFKTLKRKLIRLFL
jgi:beta-1,3-galactosyltransferase